MRKEIFKTIPGFEDYVISKLGRIISLKWNKKEYIHPTIGNDGYQRVGLYKNTIMHIKKVSNLILLTFIGLRPLGMECSHLDGNELNDKLENLKWETEKQNQQRRIEHGTDIRGEKNGMVKLTKNQVIEIKKLIKKGIRSYIIGIKFNISQSRVYHIKSNKHWAHIQI